MICIRRYNLEEDKTILSNGLKKIEYKKESQIEIAGKKIYCNYIKKYPFTQDELSNFSDTIISDYSYMRNKIKLPTYQNDLHISLL